MVDTSKGLLPRPAFRLWECGGLFTCNRVQLPFSNDLIFTVKDIAQRTVLGRSMALECPQYASIA